MTTEKAHCENCRHALKQIVQGPDGEIQIGDYAFSCRRLPPTPVLIPGEPYAGRPVLTLTAQFPPVTKAIVCGEHQFIDAPPGTPGHEHPEKYQ